MKRTIISLLLTILILPIHAKDIVWFDGTNPVTYSVLTDRDLVVETALNMFSNDMLEVTEAYAIPEAPSKATIHIYQLDKATDKERQDLAKMGFDISKITKGHDAFSIRCHKKNIIVVGANGRGAAYGILELSRLAGVSPWIWWGDVVPEMKERLTIDSRFTTTQSASVEYRGIFLNDEDWSLRHWSYSNYEKGDFGQIGRRTYKRIFELLLRLRANTIWPAMHEKTTPFFKVKGAKEEADSFGIFVGTSHCEPLLRNNVSEWDTFRQGQFNYFTNKENIQKYWAERLDEVKDSRNNMFTIGMRGIHDGRMNGAKTEKEQLEGLQNVINDQQELIRKHIGDPSKQMQVFIPYKEVLKVYENGLKVPDYVTLMWCDDNYGYITRLSNAQEQKRIGGGGVYYHLSYWGRPHDYLWLTTTQPGLIYNQMRQAYDHNMRKIWIANVHDPKVAGYDLELFLDLAWNINCTTSETVGDHYRKWLVTQFGESAGNFLFPAMSKFYRLCGERKPEFMAWSETELSDRDKYDRGVSPIRNTEFTHAFGDEMQRYLDDYKAIVKTVYEAEDSVSPELNDAYFAMIEYPVCAAWAHAVKILEAQRARQLANGRPGRNKEEQEEGMRIACAKAQKAYHHIVALTNCYNISIANGKWENIMDMHPRDLPVFGAPVLPMLLSGENMEEELSKAHETHGENIPYSWIARKEGFIARNCNEYDRPSPRSPLKGESRKAKKSSFKGDLEGLHFNSMLGHSMKAVSLPKGSSLSYSFVSDQEAPAILRIALIPTHPHDKGDVRYAVSIDGGNETVISIKEAYNSEQWKKNVLRGQSVKSIDISLTRGEHTLSIRALDDNIILDQWMIDFNKKRKHYLFPID